MEKLVAVVICVLIAVPAAGATAAPDADALLRAASRRSGLAVRRTVPERTLEATRYDAILRRALDRQYPRTLRSVDAALYARLGLPATGARADLTRRPPSTAWYDAAGRSLLLRRATAPRRARVINELVRALVDQNFGLRRLAGLRARNRDSALAAEGIVDGTAALASGIAPARVTGAPLMRFLQLDSGLRAGRSLAKELRYLGGVPALASALKTFPQTTEQLLHVDKFLERERALPVRLPQRVGELKLRASETFGELDVRSLLRAFAVPEAAEAAAGWGGGRIALYVSPRGETTAVLALRWDSYEEAGEWQAGLMRFVAAAFPGASAEDCPPLDYCWSGRATLGAGTLGTAAALAAGPAAPMLAATALAAN